MLACRKTAVTSRQGCRLFTNHGREAPRRIRTLLSIAPKFKKPKSPPPGIAMPPFFRVARKLTAKITQLSVRIPYVAGEVVGSSPPSERLAAASENLTLAPH